MRSVHAALFGGLLLLASLPAVAGTPESLAPEPALRFSGGSEQAPSAVPWWRSFGDAELSQVIDAALAGNLDIERMRAAQRQFEAVSLQSFSAISPTISANAQMNLAPVESLGFGFIPPGQSDPNAPKTYSNGNATLDAQWQVDVFGRNAATWRAAQRDVNASQGDLDQMAGQTAALVANAYYDVVTAKARVAILEAQLATNRELLEVMELRYERGDASSLDVLQQRQTVSQVEAQLPSSKLLAETTAQRLAVLLGRAPMQPPSTASSLPEIASEAVVGTPADLVENRADLRAEASRLRSARDRRWSAYAAALPTIGLTGRLGYQFIDITEYTDQTFWNAGANVSIPIFGGGRTAGGAKQARAAHDVQAAAFESAVLTAMQEVESAISQERLQREAVAAQQAQLDAATAASETARAQYLEGLAPFVNVQSAITLRQQAELTLLQGRRDLVTARINLNTAVGGPWTRSIGSADPSTPSSEAGR